jgi:D-serine deaminase-like pyridoxal phosphate-dependent protein
VQSKSFIYNVKKKSNNRKGATQEVPQMSRAMDEYAIKRKQERLAKRRRSGTTATTGVRKASESTRKKRSGGYGNLASRE